MDIKKATTFYAVIPRQDAALPAVVRYRRVGQAYFPDEDGVNFPEYVWTARVVGRFDTMKEAKRHAQEQNSLAFCRGEYAAQATQHTTSTRSIGGAGYFAYDPQGGPIYAITDPPKEAVAVTNSVYMLGRPGSVGPKIEVKK